MKTKLNLLYLGAKPNYSRDNPCRIFWPIRQED